MLPLSPSASSDRSRWFGTFLFLLLGLIPPAIQGQPVIEQRLIRDFVAARTDSARTLILGQLSQYYYANKDFEKADSLVGQQIMIAEATLSRRLILNAYFNNPACFAAATATKERSKNTRTFIKRGLDYAKSNDLGDYVAFAYANLSVLNSSDGEMEEAFNNANLAFTTALNTENDSAKVITAVQLGNIYRQRSDVLMAFRVFTNAQNIAIESKKELLLPPVYHAMATLYDKLLKVEPAKQYLNQSLAINTRLKNIEGQINDNIFLAKLNTYSAGKEYLQKAITLADQISNVILKIEAEKLLFIHMIFKEKPATMLAYLDSKPELKNVYVKTGPDYINWMMAEIYFYGGQPDSALVYFKKAEASFESKYDLKLKKSFFDEYAACYKEVKDIPAALAYYNKTFLLYREASDLRGLKSTSYQLKNLYKDQQRFDSAFAFSLLYDDYKDSVELMGRERDLAFMEIENVRAQQQRDTELAAEKLRRKFNLQYLLITVVVATAFVLMIMIGMFKVSAFAIRLMGFLSLIFFFEFIILILDTWIHHLTHGEPWKVWLIKICIISLLLPIHHFLEHKLIHYLLSRHLITVRSRLSVLKLFKTKKPLPPTVETEKVVEEEKTS